MGYFTRCATIAESVESSQEVDTSNSILLQLLVGIKVLWCSFSMQDFSQRQYVPLNHLPVSGSMVVPVSRCSLHIYGYSTELAEAFLAFRVDDNSSAARSEQELLIRKNANCYMVSYTKYSTHDYEHVRHINYLWYGTNQR